MQFKDAPRLKDFQGQENDFTMIEENFEIHMSEMPSDRKIFMDKSEWLHHGWRKLQSL